MSDPSEASIVAIHLRTEYHQNPIGMDDPRARLSWKIRAADGHAAARGLAQHAYQILVSGDLQFLTAGKADLWDSGVVRSGETTFIEYDGPPLGTAQRAYWAVRVWDQDDRAAALSAAAFWETGLTNREDWSGEWIGSHIAGSPLSQVPVPFLRKAFIVPPGKIIASARLYATALGLYECHINGRKVGDDVFTPGWTDYRHRVQYQAYDVTALLAGGENVIGALLGDGWYCGYVGNNRLRQYYGDRPRLLAELRVRFTDGSSLTVATDPTWRVAIGPIVSSDFFMGESHDARLEIAGWDMPGFKPDDRWSAAAVFADRGVPIVPTAGPCVRAVMELRPIKLTTIGTGRDTEQIADLGQNMVGRARLRVKGPAGATVRMQFVEVLDEKGRPYVANLRSARQIDTYTLKGDPAGETFEPCFTFHGFRYVAVQGYPGTLTLDDVTGVVLHSEMAETGTFECSEPLLNQLQHNIQWGQRGNFLEVPTDCPQRDERLGWTGDAQVFVRTAAFNFDVSGFFAKWTQDLRDAQSDRGEFPMIAPNNYDPDGQIPPPSSRDGGPAWADAGIICPWTMYLCYGDRSLLQQHYPAMVRFIAGMEAEAKPFGLIRSHPDWRGWHGFGDWLSQDGKDRFGGTPTDLIGTAFLSHDARLLAKIASILGETADVERFRRLGNDVAAAFCRRFVTAEGLIIGHTQTAYVLALHFDLLPETLRPAAVTSLVRNIEAHGDHLTTGFVGSPYLNHVLTRGGRSDVAFRLLMQKQWPSWLYAVTQGATTIWERWDGWTHDRGFQDAGMNSFNHYAYGAIGDWLYQVVAGIEIDQDRPGYRHVLLRPLVQPGGPLTHARGVIETIHGPVTSHWRLDGETLHYTAELPPNVTATATVPGDRGSVMESGTSLDRSAGVRVLESAQDWVRVALTSGRFDFTARLPRLPALSRERGS